MKMRMLHTKSEQNQKNFTGKQPKTQGGSGTSDGGYIWVG